MKAIQRVYLLCRGSVACLGFRRVGGLVWYGELVGNTVGLGHGEFLQEDSHVRVGLRTRCRNVKVRVLVEKHLVGEIQREEEERVAFYLSAYVS